MLKDCCFKSAKVIPEIEEGNGEFIELDKNKKLFILNYKNKNIINTSIENVELNERDPTKIINENLPKNETDKKFYNYNFNSLFKDFDFNIDLNELSDIKYIECNDKDAFKKEEFLHLGVYKNCLNYLIKNSDLNIKYHRSENDKYGYTIIHRKKIFAFNTTNIIQMPKSSKTNPLLFFIHGVGGNSNIWHKQIIYFLEKGYELVIPDLLGHGKSSQVIDEKSYEFRSLAKDVLDIFDKYKRDKNIVIGHSYGCSFTTFLAKIRGEVIDKIILISGGSPYSLDFKSPLLKFPTCLLKSIRPFINCMFSCNAYSSIKYSCIDSKNSFNIPTIILQHTMKGQYWPSGNEYFHRTLKQKILIIEGSNDNLVLWEDAFDLFRVIYNSLFIIIENGSHMSIIEQDKMVNQIIENFIK